MMASIARLLMLLAQTAEYALRAVLHLAIDANGHYVHVDEIAAVTRTSPHYLAKVLGQLTRAGVLESSRGPAGGFRLAHDPRDLTLEDVVVVFAPAAQKRRCFLGHGVCGEDGRCAMHRLWSPIATQLQDFLTTTTIADLTRPSSNTNGGAS